MPTTLHAQLTALADSFANAVLDAIRSTSLHELLSDGGRPAPIARRTGNAPVAPGPARIKRRSPEDIAGTLDQVVALVKARKDGLRAEQIRAQLRMEAKEMPRVLAEGLAKKRLRKKGQRRATTYFAS